MGAETQGRSRTARGEGAGLRGEKRTRQSFCLQFHTCIRCVLTIVQSLVEIDASPNSSGSAPTHRDHSQLL